jgi:hypothetical protein
VQIRAVACKSAPLLEHQLVVREHERGKAADPHYARASSPTLSMAWPAPPPTRQNRLISPRIAPEVANRLLQPYQYKAPEKVLASAGRRRGYVVRAVLPL